LAGDRGVQIAAALPFARRHSWSYTARTWLVDRIIEHSVLQGTDMIVNLAAGLDARPYRMELPASLRWVEIDLPDMLNYKQEVLGDEHPVCRLDRVPLDLRDTIARRALFEPARRRSEEGTGIKRRTDHLFRCRRRGPSRARSSWPPELPAVGDRSNLSSTSQDAPGIDWWPAGSGWFTVEIRASRGSGILCPFRVEGGRSALSANNRG
jgi:Leucine carboxyl methyltransferase